MDEINRKLKQNLIENHLTLRGYEPKIIWHLDHGKSQMKNIKMKIKEEIFELKGEESLK